VFVGSHSQVITLSAANDASFNFGIRVKLKSENSTHFPHSLCSTAFVLVFDLDAQEGVRGVLTGTSSSIDHFGESGGRGRRIRGN
jgi:hypothetical protein